MGLSRGSGSMKSDGKKTTTIRRSGSSEGLGSASSFNTGSFGSLPDLGYSNSEELGSINVIVRVRPLNEREISQNDDNIIQTLKDQIVVRPDVNGRANQSQSTFNKTLNPKSFTFNAVFDQSANQSEMMERSGVTRLIQMALDGYSTTVFCYGQTGSGKTHSLTGPPQLFQDRPDPFSEDHGLIYRSFVNLFDQLRERTDCTYVIKASFLEIYNEKVIDLLNLSTYKKPLQVRWSRKVGGFYVENLFTVECEEFDDLLAVLEEGMRNRAVGSHGMNDYSSRSHTILTVHVISEMKASEEGVYLSRHGKINFVDLAGSEMTKKTNSQGKTLEEANNINKSLMVLGYCISQLSDPRKRSSHIPYRDSKLTQLLSDSLAGNGVTLMIACISPARSNLSETLNTLRYAARAKHIRNKPVVVMDPREALILSLKREVAALQEENVHLRNLVDIQKTLAQQNAPQRLSSSSASARDSFEHQMINGAALNTPRLGELPPKEAQQLLHSLLQENRALRKENADLYALREALLRQQEAVTKHNERLLKQIEGRTTHRVPRPFSRKDFAADPADQVAPRLFERSLSMLSLTSPPTFPDPPTETARPDNPLSQSLTLQNHAAMMGCNNTMGMILPVSISKEMNKRGFTVKSAGTRSNSSSSSGYGGTKPVNENIGNSGGETQRKKLTDLKIDFNLFALQKNLKTKKNQQNAGLGENKMQPKIRNALKK